MGLQGIPLFIICCQLFLNSARNIVLKTSPPSPVYAAVNTDLLINCIVEDRDLVTLQWLSYRNNKVYNATTNRSPTSLVFQRLSYSDEGVYYCRAVNQTVSGSVIVAQTNVTIKVGDPPPTPPRPTLKRVCGYPPTELIISYQYVNLTSTHYPVTVDLLLTPITPSNPCVTVGNDFKVVENSIQIIRRPKHVSFQVDVAEDYMGRLPDFPYCSDDFIDCTLLCVFVRTTNAFGTKFSKKLMRHVERNCGEVADFRPINVRRNSISMGWGMPRCLRKRKQLNHNLFYWIWCEPSCGDKIPIPSNTNVISGLNKTINSLMEYTNYTLFASCSFFRSFEDAGEIVSFTVQTKEGVPRVPPTIQTITWLSECTNRLNGTALVLWKVTNDKTALHGKIRYFLITYQVVNSSSTTVGNISAGVHQLAVSGLHMEKRYKFTITVCTGGGCGEASPYYSLSATDCTSSDVPHDEVHGNPKRIWIGTSIGLGVLLVLLIVLATLAFFRQKYSGRIDLRPALPNDIDPMPQDMIFPRQLEVPVDEDYAIADGQVPPQIDPDFLANRYQELKTSTDCLSRSSSVLTCNTEM